jgi:hypothetical protein
MDQELLAQSLRLDYKTFRAIWPEANNFTNDPIARHLNRLEVTLGGKSGSKRGQTRRARDH